MNDLKNKSSRQIGRAFGYSDDDLSTPGHDALVLWVRKRIWGLLKEYALPGLSDAQDAAITRFTARDFRAMDLTKRFGPLPATAVQSPTLPALPQNWLTWYKPQIEKRVRGGWIDVYTHGSAYVDWRDKPGFGAGSEWTQQPWEFAVEVKTTIRSFGELMRQLRIYEAALVQPHGYICVASPDDRFAEDLRDQGFGFCKLEVPPEPSEATRGDEAGASPKSAP